MQPLKFEKEERHDEDSLLEQELLAAMSPTKKDPVSLFMQLSQCYGSSTRVIYDPRLDNSVVRHQDSISRLSKLQEELEDALSDAVSEGDLEMALQDERDDLAALGIPEDVISVFHDELNIKQLFEWQMECLTLPAVQSGCNLIYSAPTSAGKTLVADIRLLLNLLKNPEKKALVVVPYVSLIGEKEGKLAKMLQPLGMKTWSVHSHRSKLPPLRFRMQYSRRY